jgi:hypothetical protein
MILKVAVVIVLLVLVTAPWFVTGPRRRRTDGIFGIDSSSGDGVRDDTSVHHHGHDTGHSGGDGGSHHS